MNICDNVEQLNKIKIKCYNCNSLVRRDFMTRHRQTRKCMDSNIISQHKIKRINIDIDLLKQKIEKLENKKKELLVNSNEPN